MKPLSKFVLVLSFILVPLLGFSQVSLKGYTLGESGVRIANKPISFENYDASLFTKVCNGNILSISVKIKDLALSDFKFLVLLINLQYGIVLSLDKSSSDTVMVLGDRVDGVFYEVLVVPYRNKEGFKKLLFRFAIIDIPLLKKCH